MTGGGRGLKPKLRTVALKIQAPSRPQFNLLLNVNHGEKLTVTPFGRQIFHKTPPKRQNPRSSEEPLALRAARWLIAEQTRKTRGEAEGHLKKQDKPPSIRDAARRYKIGKSIIARHYTSLKTTGQPARYGGPAGRSRALHPEEEVALEAFIISLIDSGIYVGREMDEWATNRLRARRDSSAAPVSAAVTQRWRTRWKKADPWCLANCSFSETDNAIRSAAERQLDWFLEKWEMEGMEFAKTFGLGRR